MCGYFFCLQVDGPTTKGWGVANKRLFTVFIYLFAKSL